jgi:energy-coupling factor transporter ATP-binding protein EcfA2
MADLKKRKAPDGTERTWTADSPVTEFVSAQYPDAPKEKVDALISRLKLRYPGETVTLWHIAADLARKDSIGIALACGHVGMDSPTARELQTLLTAEHVLHLRTFGLPQAECPDSVNKHAQDMPVLLQIRPGQPEPILVLGSSGSGKTTLAAKVLPGLIASTTKREQYITVYLRAGLVTNGGKENSVADVVERTKFEIRNIVPGIQQQQATPLDICMIVVVDELGTKAHSGFLSNKEHLKQIVEGLNSIAKEVWLVLAGTGLDVITSDLKSLSDVTKIRMKPWGKEQILWLVKDRRGEGFMEAVKKVERNPILTKLASNARAAEFLVRSVGELMSYCFESADIVDTVVKKGAYDNILANGLKTCTAEQRRLVAHLVLKAVGSAKEGDATQPTFDCGGDVKVEKTCRSLVDPHIEGGMLAPLGQKFAVSMTPAITIVVAALTGNVSSLSSDWSRFERIVALCELHRLFAAAQHPVPEISIKRLREAFPAPRSFRNLKVPWLSPHQVLVNGDKAPYGDIISPFRLEQGKHNRSSAQTKANLKVELAKMGVLKDEVYKRDYTKKPDARGEPDTYDFQRFLTWSFVKQWREHDKVDTTAVEADIVETDIVETDIADRVETSHVRHTQTQPHGVTRSMYPFGQLDTKDDPLSEIESASFQFHKGKLYNPITKESFAVPHSLDLGESETLDIVFATNKATFQIEDLGSMSIDRGHVDDNGSLLAENTANAEILREIGEWVDTSKVKIKFLFCSSDE